MNANFKIRIRKDQFEIEIESSEKDFVVDKLKELMDKLDVKTQSKIIQNKNTQSNETKPKSFNEFLNEVSPASATEYIVAITYYMEKVEGVNEINVKDIKEGFRKAKFAHTNASQALINAKTQGLLMEGSAPKHFILTKTGEKFVEEKIGKKE